MCIHMYVCIYIAFKLIGIRIIMPVINNLELENKTFVGIKFGPIFGFRMSHHLCTVKQDIFTCANFRETLVLCLRKN